MEGTTIKPELVVPEQKLSSLSFSDTTPKAFRDWVESLPMANIGEMSRQLYHAIIELNQLFIPPQQRLQLLELIRPKIHYVCHELSRHYLGLAVALPEKQRKIANLSQALQLHCANGYKLCVQELLDSGVTDKKRTALAMSCHRAISELAATIVRAHQLYCPSPARSWLECHHLYRFAVRNRFATQPVDDEALHHRNASTVADCYKRILLLGCARPNQLRQNDLSQAYELFELWTDHVTCTPSPGDETLFVLDMDRDAPPVYRSLFQQEKMEGSWGFDTHSLSSRISHYLQAAGDRHNGARDLALPSSVNESLLTHLSQALGILTKRNYNRITSQGSLEVCVGLTAAHYFIAGEKNFNDFLTGNDPGEHAGTGNESTARRSGDVWAGAPDTGPGRHNHGSVDAPIQFRNHAGTIQSTRTDQPAPESCHALLVNTSPGGYCVSWESGIPTALQAGEILGVREQSSHPWSVAVVRWIRQVKNQGTQIGIELLAPSASPCGVRLLQKTGNSSAYLRGLLLPEIGVVGRPATLITPRLPFQTGSRISLLHDSREDQGTLARRISATGSISQFELKLQNQEPAPQQLAPQHRGTSEDEFDSLWPSL